MWTGYGLGISVHFACALGFGASCRARCALFWFCIWIVIDGASLALLCFALLALLDGAFVCGYAFGRFCSRLF